MATYLPLVLLFIKKNIGVLAFSKRAEFIFSGPVRPYLDRGDAPHYLVLYLGSSVTYYAARLISRDELESLCNRSDSSFRVNFHSKGRAIFS